MTNRMAAQPALSPEDLRRMFETAVVEIHQPAPAAERLAQRIPIVQRGRTIVAPPATSEKRALSDAARALAQLWKVSTNPAR